MTRQEAESAVRSARGVPVATVSRRTSMLVVGMEGWPLLPDGSVSRKLRRAEAINLAGGRIRIVPEEEFLELSGFQERTPRLHKSFPAAHVCQLLAIDEAALRRWELFGLIRAADGLYDFQDIVSLRTIAELIGRGADPASIGRSIRGLASVLPGTDRPLAQLKLIAEAGGELLAALGELLVAPDGQLMLNFSPAAHAEEAPSIPADFTDERASGSADDWLEHGRSCEGEERLEEAERAYRQALARRPHYPEAHFNLGNALRGLGRLDAAEAQFRAAIDADPAMAIAWYNLADLLEEMERVGEAVECLRRAVGVDPLYPDAHFNLASLLEAIGRPGEAARHWSAYLKLDPSSEWSDIARDRLSP